MKAPTIRMRMLLAALVPVFLISLLMGVFFLKARFDDFEQSYSQRTGAVTRQLVLASEYGLFSANLAQLQVLTSGVLLEPDVLWVRLLNQRGEVLASSGSQKMEAEVFFSDSDYSRFDAARQTEWRVQSVYASTVKLDDVYEDKTGSLKNGRLLLGQVQIGFSRVSLNEHKRDTVLLSGLISLLAMLVGLALALFLSRGVIRPISRITQLIERIGHGDFAGIQTYPPERSLSDPLRDLQAILQHTALRLMHTRDDLELQVAMATNAMREKKDEAERATLAKSRFLAAASHDLRQPTHALGMFVARLAQLPHDAPTQQLIGNLETSVRAMQGLLDGLLDISRLDAGAVKIEVQAFALQGLFDRLHEDLAQSALDKGLRLRIRPSACWVNSDATQLYRILLNLTSNALRYTQQGVVLVVARLAEAGKSVHIEVWDSGVGIAPEHHEAVFNEFFQVANAQRDRNKGMGLGLNIVQRSCRLLGHEIQLRSQLGRGTRFRLSLACASPVADSQGFMVQETVLADNLQGIAVLLIEDDALASAAQAGLLQSWGMQVQVAVGPNEALQWLHQGFFPELIISDFRLGAGSNGIDVLQQLQALLPDTVPSCLMSGDTDPSVLQAAQAAGLTMLHKPVRPAKLRNLLRHLLQDQTMLGGDLS